MDRIRAAGRFFYEGGKAFAEDTLEAGGPIFGPVAVAVGAVGAIGVATVAAGGAIVAAGGGALVAAGVGAAASGASAAVGAGAMNAIEIEQR